MQTGTNFITRSTDQQMWQTKYALVAGSCKHRNSCL